MKNTALSLLLLFFTGTAFCADVFIGVEAQAEIRKPTISLEAFKSAEKDSMQADIFYDAVRSDLYNSRYFNINEDQTPSVTSDFVADGEIRPADDKKWLFTGTLYEKAEKGKKPVFRKSYKSDEKGLRRSAHLFADEIIFKATGNKGIAHTRIAFANNGTGKKEIYIADYDGENVKKVTSDKSINLLPKWSADGSRIYYTTYRYGNPDMYEANLKTGKIQPFSTFQGLNIPGGVSPDGLTLVMTASRGKDPNIYALDIVTKSVKPLLEQKYGITSSPTWSPDGKEVAFVSDRSGNPQIHILNVETKKIRKLTRMNWCDSPAWSPDGSKIVFSGRETVKEKFNIFVSDLTGSKIVRLTLKAGNNENPVWSPDGRFIAFTSTRNGRKQVFVMDADGSAPHALVDIPGSSYTPSWSN